MQVEYSNDSGSHLVWLQDVDFTLNIKCKYLLVGVNKNVIKTLKCVYIVLYKFVFWEFSMNIFAGY